jgi:hypothetical protein
MSGDGRRNHSDNRTIPLLPRDVVRATAKPRRLRPTERDGQFEVLYWSLWKERWVSSGPFGRTILSIDEALLFIAHKDIFWVMT